MPVTATSKQRLASKTPGLCTNTADCAVGRRGKPVMVALNQPFRCPNCGGPLTPPDPADMRRSLVVPLLTGGAVLLLLLLAATWLTRPKAPVQTAARVTAPVQTAVTTPAPPPPSPPEPPVGSGQLGTTPPNSALVGSSSPAGPTSATLASGTPTQPAAAPTPAPKPTPPAAASKPAAPAAAEIKRQHRVVATRQKRRAASGELSAEMLPLDGSRPDYPAEYEDQQIPGSVSVTCMIEPDGHATGCVTRAAGGPRFAESVEHWLGREGTRFTPMMKNGHPIPARFTWNIQFFP